MLHSQYQFNGKPKHKLVILSIPYQRLIRSHLSPSVLDILTKNSNVVIVSPFAKDADFSRQYAGDKVVHECIAPYDDLPRLYKNLLALTSILRVQGYWFKNRKKLPYYWASRHIRFGENGKDTLASLPKRLIMNAISFIGMFPRAWILLDTLIGRRVYDTCALKSLAAEYDKVTLIQTASWGFQDQALAWMGRELLWRTVLIPYTTDQLFANGYLYSDFDAVCVQGTAERRFAHELHAVKDTRIINLGSLSFFSMRQVLIDQQIAPFRMNGIRRILFAGSTATYFPTESEFNCLEHLLQAIDAGHLKHIAITYRPLGDTPEIREMIEKRFPDRSRLDIVYASPTIFGLDKYTHTEWTQSLIEHLKSICGFDLAVMVLFTSLALDLTVCGTPTIAYVEDETGTLERRHMGSVHYAEEAIDIYETVPVVLSKNQLVSTINQLLNDSVELSRITKETAAAWDYNPPNILELLETVVFDKYAVK